MSKANYLTYETKRERWVFQIRVPTGLRSNFGNRTTIRVAIGKVSEGAAKLRARELLVLWINRFAEARGISTVERQSMRKRVKTERIHIDERMTDRVLASIRAVHLRALKRRLDALRTSGADAWDREESDSRRTLLALKHAARRAETTAATCALRELEANHSVVFDMSELEKRAFVDAFNADQVAISIHWLDVLDGTRKLTDLSVKADEMLPLVEVFGTDAAKLETLWRDRLKRLGKQVRPKTSAKFERIALQLAVVLQRRPVELLTVADLERLALQWQEDGNTATTIRDKLTILASLITPVWVCPRKWCKS